MKPLAVVAIILLSFSTNTWAAEEPPIELTCEIGQFIVYLHITGNPETTWYQNHSSNFAGVGNDYLHYERYPDRNLARDVFVDENTIYIRLQGGRTGVFGRRLSTQINRLTGGITMAESNPNESPFTFRAGHCIEGFKEYENNLF